MSLCGLLFQELIVGTQTAQGSQTAMGGDFVTKYTTHLSARTVTLAGWVQGAVMSASMVHQLLTTLFVTVLRLVTMVKVVTLSVRVMVCVIPIIQEIVIAILSVDGVEHIVKFQV